MSLRVRLMAFGTAMLALWGLPANGQSAQTAPNAQAFLSSVTQQYNVLMYPGFYNDYTSLIVIYSLSGASSNDECRTTLSGDLGSFIGRDQLGNFSSSPETTDNQLHTNLSRMTATMDRYKLIGLPYQLDWSRVLSVKQSNLLKSQDLSPPPFLPLSEKLAVRINVDNSDFTLRFPTEELATRAAFAMEFLRLHCDKTAQTGF
jgi:hypothetical protein